MSETGTVAGSIPCHSESSPQSRPRKRRCVAEEDRKRVTVACANCRRLKEKCDGCSPCDRCVKFGRACEAKPVEPRGPQQQPSREVNPQSSERTAYLETIARHYLGKVPLDVEHLRRVAQDLDKQQAGVLQYSDDGERPALGNERFFVKSHRENAVQYSEELSHWHFSQKISSQVDHCLHHANQQSFELLDYWRATHLRSSDFGTDFVRENLPPKHVAMFLIQVYFDFAQTNTPFVERRWAHSKLERLYGANKIFTSDDEPWVCTLLMILAVGAQFAHMAEANSLETPGHSNCEADATDDAVSVTLYHAAAKLIPNIIVTASVESVRAFLLLSHFALPLDAQGLAYTYLGLAVNMAIQNGMHRQYRGSDLSEEMHHIRSSLWWAAYGWQKRISILHGRPRSVPSDDVDLLYPSNTRADGQSDTTSVPGNPDILVRLTEWLGDIASLVQILRRSPRRLQQDHLQKLMEARQLFKRWWSHLETSQVPILQLDRPSAHLHLCYHLYLVFLGRPFIFMSAEETERDASGVERHNVRAELVDDAEYSAYEIIDICAMLEKSKGLARASYVEFGCCRAAVLVMLAQSLNGRCQLFRSKLVEGMDLIRKMAVTIASTKSEASVIAAIDAAIQQLHTNRDAPPRSFGAGKTTEARDGYESFKKWAAISQGKPSGTSSTPENTFLTTSADASDCSHEQSMLGEYGWSPFDLSLFDIEPDGISDLSRTFEGGVFSSITANSHIDGDPALLQLIQAG